MQSDVFFPPARYLAELFGVHITTARRLVREQNAPLAVVMILSRDLGVFSADWAGWKLRGAQLISPEGFEATRNDVLSLPFMRMQIATYRAENRKLQEPHVDEQPLPEQWDLRAIIGK